MASLTDGEKRNVVPNWRDYNKTAKLGEFGGVAVVTNPLKLFPIDEYVVSWENNRSIPYAGDLVSAAILNEQQTNPAAIDAAKFIILHKDEATSVLVRTAQSMIATPEENFVASQMSVRQKIEKIRDQEDFVRGKIRLLKKSRDYCCFNPIAFCELARCYVTLGQFEKARDAMEIALHLAPNHRYICRSAARFFLHIHDEDRARYVIARNPALLKDPWLLASEIAINTLMGRTSKNIKKGSELIVSNDYSPFSISELSSAIGSVEMMAGNKKKCRFYFNTALQKPNDNSLAQAKFLLSKHSDLSFKYGEEIAIPNSFEADAIAAYISEDYSKSLEAAVDWIEDMPFTSRPVQFAANLTYSFLKDYDTAVEILDLGLKANPNNPSLLNNKAYVCALSGNIAEAQLAIQEAKRLQMSTTVKVCLLATEGLTEFRIGNIEEGRELYARAIQLAKTSSNDSHLINTAILNFIREEVRANKDFDKSYLEVINKIPDDCKETIQLKKDIQFEIGLSM